MAFGLLNYLVYNMVLSLSTIICMWQEKLGSSEVGEIVEEFCFILIFFNSVKIITRDRVNLFVFR